MSCARCPEATEPDLAPRALPYWLALRIMDRYNPEAKRNAAIMRVIITTGLAPIEIARLRPTDWRGDRQPVRAEPTQGSGRRVADDPVVRRGSTRARWLLVRASMGTPPELALVATVQESLPPRRSRSAHHRRRTPRASVDGDALRSATHLRDEVVPGERRRARGRVHSRPPLDVHHRAVYQGRAAGSRRARGTKSGTKSGKSARDVCLRRESMMRQAVTETLVRFPSLGHGFDPRSPLH